MVKEMRPTETKPFSFQQTHKGAPRDYLDNENIMAKIVMEAPKVDKIQEARAKMDKKPLRQPSSTKKFEAYQEKMKKEKEEKRKRNEQILKED